MANINFLSRLERWVDFNKAAWPEIRSQKYWLRTMRKAMGIKGYELAQRMAVSAARVSVLENDEEQGAVTLKMMQKAAQALDCEFVYMLVPRKSLSNTVDITSRKARIRVSPDETKVT